MGFSDFVVAQVDYVAGVAFFFFRKGVFGLSGCDGSEATGADRVERSILILATREFGHRTALSETRYGHFRAVMPAGNRARSSHITLNQISAALKNAGMPHSVEFQKIVSGSHISGGGSDPKPLPELNERTMQTQRSKADLPIGQGKAQNKFLRQGFVSASRSMFKKGCRSGSLPWSESNVLNTQLSCNPMSKPKRGLNC